MNENDLKLFREKLEDEFNNLLEKGEDVRCFLYFPYNFLTENIKHYLDEFLMVEAYKEIEAGSITPRSFTVYQDPLITVKLETVEQQVELLERLLLYFTKREEYEKCSRVHNLLKQII
jgi:hypothetical protein